MSSHCRDTLIVSLINCGTSLFAGFVIFSTLGFAAFKLNMKVGDVVKGGEYKGVGWGGRGRGSSIHGILRGLN